MEQFNVTGMSCAACSARVEKAVKKVPGVTSCSVSLLTNSMGVEGTASDAAIIRAVQDAGPGAFFPTYVRQYTLRSAALALWHHLLLDRGQHDGFILYLSILPVSPPKSSLFASGRYVGKAVRRLWGLRTA